MTVGVVSGRAGASRGEQFLLDHAGPAGDPDRALPCSPSPQGQIPLHGKALSLTALVSGGSLRLPGS